MDLQIQLAVAIIAVLIFVISLRAIIVNLSNAQFPMTTGFMFGNLLYIVGPIFYMGVTGEIPLTAEFIGANFEGARLPNDFFPVLAVALCGIGTVVFSYLVETRLSIPSGVSMADNLDLERSRSFLALCIGIAMAILILIINVKMTGVMEAGGHWARSREEFIHRQGGKAILILAASFGFVSAVVGLAARYAMCTRWPAATFVMAAMPVTLLDMVLRGNRITTVQAALAFVFLCLYLRSWRSLSVVALCSPVVLWGLGVFRFIRAHVFQVHSLSELYYMVVNRQSELDETFGEKILSSMESMSILSFILIVKNFQLNQSLTLDKFSLLKPLFVVVPTSMFPDKPRTVSLIVGDELLHTTTSVNPTLPGEGFVNFWYFGIPIAVLAAFIFIYYPIKLAARDKVGWYVLVITMAFIAFRMPLDAVWQCVIPMVLSYFLCTWLARCVIKEKSLY